MPLAQSSRWEEYENRLTAGPAFRNNEEEGWPFNIEIPPRQMNAVMQHRVHQIIVIDGELCEAYVQSVGHGHHSPDWFILRPHGKREYLEHAHVVAWRETDRFVN